mmetsp:Transcript_16523/g.23980  ORF Transcript_16523/g.23980 Transcript_16523/m.23980 type:complete len:95 (-) Transcript_16523:869-1153(-)
MQTKKRSHTDHCNTSQNEHENDSTRDDNLNGSNSLVSKIDLNGLMSEMNRILERREKISTNLEDTHIDIYFPASFFRTNQCWKHHSPNQNTRIC